MRQSLRSSRATKTAKSRLEARCGDLLEIRKVDRTGILQYNVYFLHASVSKFLETTKSRKLLSDWIGSPFDPHSAFSRGILTVARALPPVFPNEDVIGQTMGVLTSHFFNEIKCSEMRNMRFDVPTLLEFGKEAYRLYNKQAFEIRSRLKGFQIDPRIESERWITELCAEGPFTLTTIDLLRQNPRLLESRGSRPLLDIAVGNSFSRDDGFDHRLVEFLMGQGADPNEAWDSDTIWKRFLSRVIQVSYGIEFPKRTVINPIRTCLRYGADPDACIYNEAGQIVTVAGVIERKTDGHEQECLLRLLNEKKLENEKNVMGEQTDMENSAVVTALSLVA